MLDYNNDPGSIIYTQEPHDIGSFSFFFVVNSEHFSCPGPASPSWIRRAAALRCSNGALRITGDGLSATFSEAGIETQILGDFKMGFLGFHLQKCNSQTSSEKNHSKTKQTLEEQVIHQAWGFLSHEGYPIKMDGLSLKIPGKKLMIWGYLRGLILLGDPPGASGLLHTRRLRRCEARHDAKQKNINFVQLSSEKALIVGKVTVKLKLTRKSSHCW